MKILISDYKEELQRDVNKEIRWLKEALEDVSVEVYPYENQEGLIQALRDTDCLLTAFLPIDETVLRETHKLKYISVNAVGYSAIDVECAKLQGIQIAHVKEYCTDEVADHTMALILALERELKHYQIDIEEKHSWSYQSISGMKRLRGQTLAIFGLGRIGQAVLRRAQAFGMQVIAVDPYLPADIATQLKVELVTKEEALERADVISNHMNATELNKEYFSDQEFARMKKQPIFINVARGETVNQEALVNAIEQGSIKAAGIDVLKEENPKLTGNPLLGRENVILTPHAAFYSDTSMEELQRISIDNIIHMIRGEFDQVFALVTK